MDALDKVITKVVGLPHKPLSNAIFWLGLIIVIYYLAQISWTLAPKPQTSAKWQPTTTSSNVGGMSSVDLDGILQLSLFGKHDVNAIKKPEPVQELITDAPQSSLSILLTGVVASTTKKQGLAIVSSSGVQATYGIGDKIKGTSASLKEVYADRIIISNGGRYETVMLDGVEFSTQNRSNLALQKANQDKAPKKVDKRNNAKVAAELARTRKEVLSDPNKLTDFLTISPIRSGGQLQGYRLNPGSNPKVFADAGFKSNDVAVSINGYDLTDISQALEVMAKLPDLQDMSVMVERNGQLIEISLGLPQ
ncbi:MAG: type II secretion system protein GspC [Parashewanella sp.]